MVNKIPPKFVEGERAVLGACLIDNDCIHKVQTYLDISSFYSSNHGVIFEAIIFLAEANTPINFITLGDRLQKMGQLDHVGGREYIIDLIDACPSSANVTHYCTIVRQKAALRRMISGLSDLISSCYESDADAETIKEDIQKMAFTLSKEISGKTGLVHISTIMTSIIDSLSEGKKPGLPSGFLNIDHYTGGFMPGELVIVGGRPSMGKSALATDIAISAVKQTAVAFFSLEMSKEELISRFISKGSHVNLKHLRCGSISQSEWPSIQKVVGRLVEHPVLFDDSGTISVSQIRSRVREAKMRMKLNIGLVIIDYLQLLKTDSKYNSQNDKISAVTRSLKWLAKELECPVICLSQLNRQIEQRPFKGHERRPRMSDFRDSGSIEQDADIILGLYRPEVYDDSTIYKGKAEALILKHRNGPTGIAKLLWHPEIATFSDAPHEINPVPPYQDRDTDIMPRSINMEVF